MLAFYSDDLSSNLTELYNYCLRPKAKDLVITRNVVLVVVVVLGFFVWSMPCQLPRPCYPQFFKYFESIFGFSFDLCLINFHHRAIPIFKYFKYIYCCCCSWIFHFISALPTFTTCYPQFFKYFQFSIYLSINPSGSIFFCQSIDRPLPFPKYL